MQRNLYFLLILFALAAIFVAPTAPASPAFAQDSVQATVGVDTLNVRSQPGTDAPIIASFNLDTVVNVTGREDQLDNGGIWVFAQPVSGGSSGWVLSDFLLFPAGTIIEYLPVIDTTGVAVEGESTENIASPEGTLSGNTINNINFRGGPGTNYPVLQGLTGGVNFVATGRNQDGAWIQVNIGSTVGWLYTSLVNVNGTVSSLEIVPAPELPTGAGSNTGAALPPPISGGGLPGFGYGAHVANFNNGDLMAQMGMTWVKVQVRYSRGAAPESVSGLISTAHAQGLRILLGVVGYPGDVVAGESYFNDYANFVGGAAALGADAIEVWNEPNLDREWATGYIDGAYYTQLLARAYNAIKANNPGTVVISAALAPTGAEGAFGLDRVWNDDRFLRSMASAGAASYMDCVGAHYNEGIISPYQSTGDPRNEYYTRYLYGMIRTYRAIIPSRPLCFTELGFLSGEGFPPLPGAFGWAVSTSVAEHALWSAQAIDVARSSGVVRIVIFWNLNFTGVWGADPMGGYAFIRPDGTCPACAYFPR